MLKVVVCLALAAAVAPAAPTCGAGNLSTYIALGEEGCSIGDMVFANFTYEAESDQVEAPLADDIDLVPLNSERPGLEFDVDQYLTPRLILEDGMFRGYIRPWMELLIGYTLYYSERVDRASLAGQLSSDILGTAWVNEQLSNGESMLIGGGARPSARASFAPASSLSVSNRIRLATGSSALAGGQIGTFENRFDAPEPATLLITGAGLVLLGFLRRRRA